MKRHLKTICNTSRNPAPSTPTGKKRPAAVVEHEERRSARYSHDNAPATPFSALNLKGDAQDVHLGMTPTIQNLAQNEPMAPDVQSDSPQAPQTPDKKRPKWSSEEDAQIIKLRRSRITWVDISKKIPGRSAASCRLRYKIVLIPHLWFLYKTYLERRSEWSEDRKTNLAGLYE
ncbi:hypothetical protein ACJ73_09778, partial [Blastomyces percursus]